MNSYNYTQVCQHMYQCTCIDFITHAVPCKHVHAVHSYSKPSFKPNIPNPLVNNFADFLEKQPEQSITEVATAKETLRRKIDSLLQLASNATSLGMNKYIKNIYDSLW